MFTKKIINNIVLFITLNLLAAGGLSASPTGIETQPDLKIAVNGQTLAQATAEERGGQIFLPAQAIARALGDLISVNAAARTVTVRRQTTGVAATYDGELDQVSEDGAIVLVLPKRADISFSADSEIMLPLEIVAVLSDAAVRLDPAQAKIYVIRGGAIAAEANSNTERRRRLFELYRADYEANWSGYSSSVNQSYSLTAVGRLLDGRFSLGADFDGILGGGLGSVKTSSRVSAFSFRRAQFLFERAGGQKFEIGDLGTARELPFLATTLRGAATEFPEGNFRINLFAGKTRSGFPKTESFEVNSIFESGANFAGKQFRRLSSGFDTTIFGLLASRRFAASGSSPITGSFGWSRSASGIRGGDIFSGSLRRTAERFSFSLDAALGKFSQRDPISEAAADRFGQAFDFRAAYRISPAFGASANWQQVGRNFQSPQRFGREPLKFASANLDWRPAGWLSASLGWSRSARPGIPDSGNASITAAVNVNPSKNLPALYIVHTESRSRFLRKSSSTLISLAREISRWRISGSLAESRILNLTAFNAQIGVRYLLNDKNALEVTESLGNGKSNGGFIDYFSSNLFNDRVSFGGGIGYARRANAPNLFFGRLSASLRLPKETAVQINYSRSATGAVFFISARGNLLRKKQISAAFDAPLAEINRYGSCAGRVYQDVNLNGQFDAGIDRAQNQVTVRLDGSRTTVTDADGFYRFENVRFDNHRLELDSGSVRADLTFLDAAGRSFELAVQHQAAQLDFRLIRTGRVTGFVWLDKNENGLFDDGESPLIDVRVLVGGKDTLSDENGAFTVGDLAPGEYTALLDQKTLPARTTAWRWATGVRIAAGRATVIKMPVLATPAEIKEFK